MTVTYRPAAAVERIATTLIQQHHHDLDDVRIDYVFRSETAKSAGKEIWGKARKISGLNAYLGRHTDTDSDVVDGDDFFVIEISEPVWRILDDKQRRALVDHELCHCTTAFDEDTGELTLKVRSHDLEEFRAVVDRHGIWRDDIQSFADAIQFQQLDLDTIGNTLSEIDATVSVNGGPPVPINEAGELIADYLASSFDGGGDTAA